MLLFFYLERTDNATSVSARPVIFDTSVTRNINLHGTHYTQPLKFLACKATPSTFEGSDIRL